MKRKVEHSARVEIYGLCDPETKEVRYVGKANNSIERLAGHMREIGRRDYPLYRWLAKLLRSGKKPDLVILAISDELNWRQEEQRQIKLYQSKRLLNVAKGGDEPYCPAEVRAANGCKNARLIHSDVRKKHIWTLKHKMGILLKELRENNPRKYEEIAGKLRIAAQKSPKLFSCYANL